MKIGVLLLFLGIGLTGQIKSTSQAGLDAIHLPSESAVRLEGTDLTLVLKHMDHRKPQATACSFSAKKGIEHLGLRLLRHPVTVVGDL